MLQGNRKTTKIDNPYLLDNQKEMIQPRKTFKLVKEQETKELKREVAAMTTAVGYKGNTKHQAEEVMILNSKSAHPMQPMTKKERMEQQEELKRKVNKLFDTRASSPVIINKLKKTDTVLSKVNNINENYFASRGKSPRVIHAVYVDSIAKKKASASANKVNLIKE